MIKNIRHKISKLKCEIVTKAYYKNLEKAPIHLLSGYWKLPTENLYRDLLNNEK